MPRVPGLAKERQINKPLYKESESYRPVLSDGNVDIFYQKLEEDAHTKTQLDNYKTAFGLYVANKNVPNDRMIMIIQSTMSLPYKQSKDILIYLSELVRLIEHETAQFNLTKDNFMKVKRPKAFKYVDQYGKKWECLNEFFGL